ncbi:MAG: methyltransferase domain-containing protein, partial [Planctomycetota bacterium]
LKNFLSSPGRVGAIAPSSPALVRVMMGWFDWANAGHIVEYGPGTGVFTEGIQRHRRDDSQFFAVEFSPDLAASTRKRCPDVDVIEGSAADIESLCESRQMPHIDALVCGLPWATFPVSLQDAIMDATLKMLRPGGQFATFTYIQSRVMPASGVFVKRLQSRFSQVERSPIAWRNLPPAFVYRCTK